MAISGRKISDFQASISRGSAEDFDHSCDSCLADDQHVEAHGFCVNCQEYLCKHCLRCHQRNKASKNHQLLDKDQMDKHAASTKRAEVCTEICSIHRNEIIKFFCPRHDNFGCSDCMIMNHRNCDLDYIPDKCVGIGDGEEYGEIMKKLTAKMKEADAVMKKATTKDKEIDDSYDKVNKEFVTFRKEIDDHLDILQSKIAANASTMKSTNKQEVQSVLTLCTTFTSDLKKLQSTLQNSKAGGQNGQLFLDIKRAEAKLQSHEMKQAEFALDKVNTQISFSRNRDLEHILSLENFGKPTEFSTATASQSRASTAVPPKANTAAQPTASCMAPTKPYIDTPSRGNIKDTKMIFSSISHEADINVKTKSNKIKCNITGIAVLSSSRIVLADCNNKTLKLVDIQKKAVVEEKYLDTGPRDIAVLPEDHIAVKLPDKRKILLMTTTGKLSTDQSITVKGVCRGITYHQDCLYVVCCEPYTIYVLDLKGNVKTSISLADTAVFSSPNYIVLSQDHKLLYVSNLGNNSVVSVTLEGKVSAVYKDKDLGRPKGMLVLDDGSLLVCYYDNSIIHHVSADLKQGQTVMDGVSLPQSICYSADRSQIYVGGWNGQLKVFDILSR